MPECEAVMDVIDNPLMTRLCQQARKRGLVHVNGLEMLVAQAKQAVEHFLDKPVNDEVIDEIYRRLIAELQHRAHRHAERWKDEHRLSDGCAMRKTLHRYG